MTVQTLGDIHGRVEWKELVDLSYDKIVFLGDYVDDFPPVTDEQIINNLLDIIQFKKDNPDKIVLLWGNHDEQYLFRYATHGCSGYRASCYIVLHEIFNDNKDLFQASFQIKNYIWTHAGMTKTFYDRFKYICGNICEGNLSTKINAAFNSSHEWILSEVGPSRGGIRGNIAGIFWADKSDLLKDPLNDFHQIVGHTPQRKEGINTFNLKNGSYTFCDVFPHFKETYKIEIL